MIDPMGLTTVGDLKPQEVPKEIMRLAEQLAHVHGAPLLTSEKSGRHIYIASPAALEIYGAEELEKRNLTINADKHFGIGKWKQFAGTYDADLVGYCFKTQTPYRVSSLLAMLPLDLRGYPMSSGVQLQVRERFLVDDGRGNMIPDHPGQVVSITQLPSDHVAVRYLLDRRYNLANLEAQFGCAYCYRENSERWLGKDDPANLKYRPLPGGFKDTPQGRIIFYAYINGVQVGWQARVIDKWVGDCHYYWHPYDNCWALVEIKVGVSATGKAITMACPPFDTKPPFTWENPKWDISKYKTGKGVSRSELVMGLDAAVAWNLVQGRRFNRIGIGSEGPLDAGRFRPPAVALIGKELSNAQVKLIIKHFDQFIWAGDDDVAGRKASLKVRAELGPKMVLHEVTLPFGKDPGELADDIAHNLVAPYLYP
jgi:hypothetical protein